MEVHGIVLAGLDTTYHAARRQGRSLCGPDGMRWDTGQPDRCRDR